MSFPREDFGKDYVPFVRPTDARKFRGNVPRRRPLNGAVWGFRENDWDSGMTES
jgi:hypothetical protein